MVGYNYIMDALDAECIAMDLDGGQRVAVGVHVIEALEPSEVAYELRRVEGAVLAGCEGAKLSRTDAVGLTRGVMNRLSSAPIMVPQGIMLKVLAEEAIALKVDPMKMALLSAGVLRRLNGEAAGQAFMDRLIELMRAKEEGRPDPPPSPSEAAAAQTPYDLDKVIGALMDECVLPKLDLMTMFMLGKHLTFRLGGEQAGAKYVEKVTALMEMTQALQKLDKACR